MKEHKKKALALSALIMAFLLMAAGSGSDSDSKNTSKIGEVNNNSSVSTVTDQDTETSQNTGESQQNNNSQSPESEAKSNENKVYHVGDILQNNDVKIVYKSSGNYTSKNELMKPDEGKKFIFIELYCENLGDSDHNISSFDFKCYADGYACDSKYFDESQLSATLSKGRSTTGKVYFSVPENASDIQIEYSANLFSDEKIVFAFEGDKDSGFKEENKGASENTYKIGDIVKTKDLVISFLSGGKYTSDNMFMQPKEGYQYIYCEFEFENISDSDKSITFYDFDCFADGTSCEAFYGLEDSLSGTLSPKRKIKGKVAFEVPVAANSIEIEYVNNMWTSDRVIFTYQ